MGGLAPLASTFCTHGYIFKLYESQSIIKHMAIDINFTLLSLKVLALFLSISVSISEIIYSDEQIAVMCMVSIRA